MSSVDLTSASTTTLHPHSDATSSKRYDVFISYSHAASGQLAPAIQRGLERFARPWNKRRALRVFRDTSGFGITEALWPRIADAIGDSRHFLLLGSPQAAASPWVRREVEERLRGAGHVLIALTAGQVEWDAESHDFNWTTTDALPRSLSGHFAAEPLYLDLRWANNGHQLSLDHAEFRDAIAALGAAIRGVDKDELNSEAVRVHRRAMRVAWSAVAALAILLATSVVFGLAARSARDDALRALARSEARRIALEASNAPRELPQRRLLLAVEAVRVAQRAGLQPSSGELQAVRDHMIGGRPLVGHMGGVTDLQISPLGSDVLTTSSDSTARVWSLDSDAPAVVLKGHQGVVLAGAFDAEGRRVITGGDDGTARIWAADGTGTPIVLATGGGAVQGVAFSPDGSLVATVADEKEEGSLFATVKIWRSDGSGEPRVVGRSVGGPDAFVEFSPDGRWLLSESDDFRSARVARVDGNQSPLILSHSRGLRYATFGPAGLTVVTASVDGTARIWPLDDLLPMRPLTGHQHTVFRAAFSRDGGRVVTASFDGSAVVWPVRDGGQPTQLLGHEDFVYEARFSPDTRHVITTSADRTARLWRTGGQGPPRVFRGHESRVWRARFTLDGAQIITAGEDNAARVWNVWADGEPRILWGHGAGVWEAAVSADGHRVLTVSSDGDALLWDLRGHRAPVLLDGHTNRVMNGHFSPDGTIVATGSTDRTVRLWRVSDGQLVRVLGPSGGQMDDVSFNASGTYLVSSAWEDGFVRLWDVATGAEVARLNAPGAKAYSTTFSPDGSHVLTGWTDGIARVWDLAGRKIREFDTGTGRKQADSSPAYSSRLYVAYSPDGSRVLTYTDDMYEDRGSRMQIWLADGTGVPVEFDHGTTSVASAVFSPDGSRVATAGGDNAIRIWPTEGGGEPRILRAHEDVILDMSFSPNGRRLVTASRDKTALVWEFDSQEPPAVLRGHQGEIRSARFTPDGQSVVTASDDGTARVWTLSADALVEKACAALGRNFEVVEWTQYLGALSPVKTCPQWSLGAAK